MVNFGEKADFWSDHGILLRKEKFKFEYTACHMLAFLTEIDVYIYDGT